MKYFLYIFLFLCASCATMQPPPPVDLETKGVIRVDVSVVDFDTRESGKPTKVYFAEIPAPNEFKSERIIASERIDSDGNIYVNLAPGLYSVVGVERYYNAGDGRGVCLIDTLFDNDLMTRSAVKLEKGATQVVKFRVLSYSDTILDKTPESVKYYRKILTRNMSIIGKIEIGKFLDSPDSRKKYEEEKKKAEETGPKIEKY